MTNYCAAGSGNTTARPCSSCLQARLRGHRVEAARLALPFRSHQRLAQVQESGSAGGEARGGRGLGQGRTALTTPGAVRCAPLLIGELRSRLSYCAAGSGNTTARPCSSCLQARLRGESRRPWRHLFFLAVSAARRRGHTRTASRLLDRASYA
jgi:hypothetical protein